MVEDSETKQKIGLLHKDLAGYGRKLVKALDAARKVIAAADKGKNVALFTASELQVADKALDELAEEPVTEKLVDLRDGLLGMRKTALASVEHEAMRLLSELDGRLRARNMRLEGHYPEVGCGVLNLEFQLTEKGMVVNIRYGPGIEKLDSVSGADTEEVWKKLEAQQQALDDSLMPAEDFLKLAVEAWRLAHFNAGHREAAGPAPILDVLSALAYLAQKETFHRNPVRSLFKSYGATALSYQLFKLRDRRYLDLELVMGIATREDVRRRASVWVPRNLRGDGNHFSTLEFRKVS